MNIIAEQILSTCRDRGWSPMYAVYWATHQICEACGQKESGPPHHILGRSAHGTIDEPWNLLSLCFDCNYGRGGAHGINGGNKALAERCPAVAGKIKSAYERRARIGVTTGELMARVEAFVPRLSGLDEARELIEDLTNIVLDLSDDVAQRDELIAGMLGGTS